MGLQRTITLAHDLTKRLHEALENQDLEVCRQLLEQREQAMAEFEKKHRETSDQDRAGCRSTLESLKQADKHLRERSQIILAMVTEEFRGQLGSPVMGHGRSDGDQGQACLDRKV